MPKEVGLLTNLSIPDRGNAIHSSLAVCIMTSLNYQKNTIKKKLAKNFQKAKDQELWEREKKQISKGKTNFSEVPKESLEEFLARDGQIEVLPVKYKTTIEDRLAQYAELNRAKDNLGEKQVAEILDKLEVRYYFQHPMVPYIADFYLPDHSLIIEVDGDCHKYTTKSDIRRDSYFRNRGIETIRLPSGKVSFSDVQQILEVR